MNNKLSIFIASISVITVMQLNLAHSQSQLPPSESSDMALTTKASPPTPDPELQRELDELGVVYDNGKYRAVSESGELTDIGLHDLMSSVDCSECMLTTDIFKLLTKEDVKHMVKKQRELENLEKKTVEILPFERGLGATVHFCSIYGIHASSKRV